MSDSVLITPPAAAGGFAFCTLCPRACKAPRQEGKYGFCQAPSDFLIARAAPHFGEEPCISGTGGSGAVFFVGCNLRCIFCQNHGISRGQGGKRLSGKELSALLLRLQDSGVHNINLVTPTHYSDALAEVLRETKLEIPVVWNSSGYESVEQLKKLEGLVQIYMPDFKYSDAALAARFSAAPDYPQVALAAVREMYRQTGPFRMGEDRLLQSGVLLRHLILPGHIENTLRVMDLLEDELPVNRILFSLMSQYTPPSVQEAGEQALPPELRRTLSEEELQRVMDYLDFSSIEEGFVQDRLSATEELLPAFDLTGLS